MAWIESHQQLERHPKTHALMSAMGWDLDAAIGKLMRFWWWSLDFAPSGDLRKYNDAQIGGSVGLAGSEASKFVKAMVESSWIDRGEGVFRIHDWTQYAGRYLRDTKFKRYPDKWAEVEAIHAMPCVPVTKPVSRQSADMSGQFEDMSAVPNQPTNQPNLTNHTPPPTSSGKPSETGYTQEFVSFWEQYPNKKAKDQAWKAWQKRKDRPNIQTILAAVETQKKSRDWIKDGGQYIPHPATWINAGRWADETKAGMSQAALIQEERSRGQVGLTQDEMPPVWNPMEDE